MPHRVGRTATGRPVGFDPNDLGELDRALSEQEAFFSEILDDLPVMVSRFLPDGTLTYANARLCEAFGETRDALFGTSLFDRIPAEQHDRIREGIRALTPEHPQWVSENRVIGPDGTFRWQRWTNRGLFDEQDRLREIQAIGEDISERSRNEDSARGILRARHALKAVNQAVTRAKTEEGLLDAACRSLVQVTGYEMAWVGLPAEDPDGWFHIAAHAGDDHGYLGELNVSFRDDRPEGRGPTGRAFRSGQAVAVQDLQGDAITAPWHQLAARAGLASGAAIPLKDRNRTLGTLNIYSAQACPFGEDELDLLQELADELALGLVSLQAEAEARTVRDERDRLTAILDATPDFVGIADAEGNVLYHNLGAKRILGAPADQPATHRNVQQSHSEASGRRVLEEGFPTAREKGVWQGEVAIRNARGQEIPFSQTILAHYAPSGAVSHYSTIARDISDQKAIQDRLRQQFFTAVEVFGNLLELHSEHLAGHCRRVQGYAVAMARLLGYGGAEVDDLYLAALLHEVGKLGMPETLLNKPYALLTASERERFRHHPALGEAALMALEPLDEAARLIRHQHEYLDGSGFPDGIAGEAIPRGARILAVANDYDNLRSGRTYMKSLDHDQALAALQEQAGILYDPEAVDALARVHEGQGPAPEPAGARVPAPATPERDHRPARSLKTSQLTPGMVLADDLTTKEGMLLLSRERQLDERAIEKIRRLELRYGHPLSTKVYAASEDTVPN